MPSADGIGSAARFIYPSGIAVDNATNLYVADSYNNTIRKLAPIGTNWVVTTLGGIPGFHGTADGTGSTARFSNPNGVAVDGDGNLYVADFYFNTIRKGYPLIEAVQHPLCGRPVSFRCYRAARTGGGRGNFERSGELAVCLDEHQHTEFQRPAERHLFESLLPHPTAIAERRRGFVSLPCRMWCRFRRAEGP